MKERRNNLRISAIMKEKVLTLPDLAARITVTDKDNNKRTQTSSALGARINGNPHLYEIADALDVKITELFPPEDQCTKAPAAKFKIQTICPSCGAKINASVTAE